MLALIVSLIIGIGFLVFCKYQEVKNKASLESLPFIIFITDKDFNIKYKNEEASFIDKIYIKEYCENFCTIYLDKDYRTPFRTYSFINGEDIYFIAIEQDLELNRVVDCPTIEKNFKLKLMLEYVGRLLNSDWVSYYTKKGNKFIIVEEYWKNKDIKTYYGDEVSIDALIKDENWDITKPYFFMTIDKLVTRDRIEQWKKIGVHTKVIIPICNRDGELEKAVTFSYYPNKTPVDTSTIQLVAGIVNYIVGIKLKFEIENKYQEQVNKIQDSLMEYINKEKRHRLEMNKRTSEMLASLEDVYEKDSKIKKIQTLYEKDYTKE